MLPNKPSDPEAIGVLAHALAATGKLDNALSLIDDTDENKLPEHVKTGFLAIRARAYMARGEKQLAMDTIAQRIAAQPKNLLSEHYRYARSEPRETKTMRSGLLKRLSR